jgi:hypothetical protein
MKRSWIREGYHKMAGFKPLLNENMIYIMDPSKTILNFDATLCTIRRKKLSSLTTLYTSCATNIVTTRSKSIATGNGENQQQTLSMTRVLTKWNHDSNSKSVTFSSENQ